ncbi:dipicolinic acid synthetase subunit A [Pseudalkalibacillus berkeleyi]|uniref:Dipicolinic acid synthetase subunit A n=1 Tax=Pseudalkalibacillus berkeleyi TaxID=1069813 RepID=A0ABS9GZU1_9BACL|nr:dipicolinic acid synthetase subunit A [Pseudalkalibacillus berkeleyi]MCF6137159.1 dipicolinic acid synthetase subunit A [Pseudalkalibacillus berkeleyi]
MLTGINAAIIGGDARQLEVIRKLTELDAHLYLVGFDQLDHGFTGATKMDLDDLPLEEIDALILPVSGSGPKGEIDTIFSNQKIQITEEMMSKLKEDCTVFSGITNDYLTACTSSAGKKHIKLFERDDVAIYNAIPTVEGTIMMVIQHTDFTIHQSNIMVLGFGRVGFTVARTFANLGANVSVGARRSEHIARITELGFKPFHLQDLENEVSSIDVCINTIPAQIITSNVISKIPSHTLIIDLASKPGGTDFRFAEKRGIKALLAPGLPGIVAPKTAGKIIANVLTQLLIEERNKGKG